VNKKRIFCPAGGESVDEGKHRVTPTRLAKVTWSSARRRISSPAGWNGTFFFTNVIVHRVNLIRLTKLRLIATLHS